VSSISVTMELDLMALFYSLCLMLSCISSCLLIFLSHAYSVAWLLVFVGNIHHRHGSFDFLLQFQRRNRIYKEEQRKLRAASQKADGGDGKDNHH